MMKSPHACKNIYGLIGYPLVHSFSRDFFNQKFMAEDIDAQYINFEIEDIGQLMEVIAEYPNLNGLPRTRKRSSRCWTPSMTMRERLGP